MTYGICKINDHFHPQRQTVCDEKAPAAFGSRRLSFYQMEHLPILIVLTVGGHQQVDMKDREQIQLEIVTTLVMASKRL